MKQLARAAVVLVALAHSACAVKLSKSEGADILMNRCTSDSECGDGSCWLGVCVAHEGVLSTLLVELTPPATAPGSGIGGGRFVQMESGLARSNEQHDSDLQAVSTVHGYVKSACSFDVTLTPEEQSFGLPAVTYVAQTVPASPCPDSKLPLSGDTQEFVVEVPPGTYDAYLVPRQGATPGAAVDGGSSGACDGVPWLFRGLVSATSGVSCVALNSPVTHVLDVEIPWSASATTLDGWKIDVLHPTSGQVLSQTVAPLQGAPVQLDGHTGYKFTIKYSPAVSDDTTNHELLRLSPPSPGDGPVVQLSLVGLLASSPIAPSGMEKAIWPPVGPFDPTLGGFPSKVSLDGWVWEADAFQKGTMTPVPSTVTFSATRLDGLTGGIFASYSTTAAVLADGHLSVALLPGDYRVWAVPQIDPLVHRNLAAQETTWSVAKRSDGVTQSARSIYIPSGASISGRAESALNTNVVGAAVQALPGSIGAHACEGSDASTCAAQPIGVLETSLAEGAFVPRAGSAVTGGNGGFTLQNLDCGGCTAADGAMFDLVVQPADGSRLPWILRPNLIVSQGELELGPVLGTLPIVQRGMVEIPNKGAEPTPVPGTLIRAYVIRDATGALISNPDGLSSCSDGTYSGGMSPTRCIRSVLQVAETRADANGKYELVLPSAFDGTR